MSPLEGNPRIVASRASVDTCVYSAAVSPAGCGTERTDITGWAVMQRGVLARILDERDRALTAVSTAEAVVSMRSQADDVRLELARQCVADAVCKAKAKPGIDRIIGAKGVE